MSRISWQYAVSTLETAAGSNALSLEGDTCPYSTPGGWYPPSCTYRDRLQQKPVCNSATFPTLCKPVPISIQPASTPTLICAPWSASVDHTSEVRGSRCSVVASATEISQPKNHAHHADVKIVATVEKAHRMKMDSKMKAPTENRKLAWTTAASSPCRPKKGWQHSPSLQ